MRSKAYARRTEQNGIDSADLWVRVPAEAMGPERYVVEVAGDSMEPTLHRGEHVVIEWHRTPRRRGQVVVMCRAMPGGDGAEVALKRFDETPTHWLFGSDNPAPEFVPIRVAKAEQPRYPILGVAVYNLSREERIR